MALLLSVVTIVSILGFQGDKFKKPPLEALPDMDRQLKVLEQSETRLFADRRADRLPPVGVVSRGDARLGNAFSAPPTPFPIPYRQEGRRGVGGSDPEVGGTSH